MLRILEFFMLSINKTVLLGNMAQDPEFRTFPSGDRIASFTVCTSEKWKDRATGELKERTEWHKVQARERHTVDYLDRFAQKGTRVYVEGILRTRKVPSNDGGPDRYFTEIDANIVSLENRLREGEQGQGHGQSHERPAPAPAAQQPRAARPRPAAPVQRDEGANHGYGDSHGHDNIPLEPSGFENDPALAGNFPKF